jgi:1-deoxy-D-xylulose-5-phosphate reductoisomerase
MTVRSRRLIVLGSTGSIGANVLAVVEHLRQSDHAAFSVVGLGAGANAALLREQADRFGVTHLAIADDSAADLLAGRGAVFTGPAAAEELVKAVARPGDLLVGAMVGSAGLPATLAAVERGCDIALANKETLVAAGGVVIPAVNRRGVRLLPIDSEHSAILQCLPEASNRRTTETATKDRMEDRRSDVPAAAIDSAEHQPAVDDPTFRCCDVSTVRRLVLTASGGPFRTWPRARIERATVEEALNHPTWSMGPKITVDSATMMNKALEIIEAHWLFGLPADRIDVIIHPQSLVHSFVEFVDGSVIAQLGPPDMRTPIQYALTWPRRATGCSRALNWSELRRLDFEPVDHARFPLVRLAYDVVRGGGSAGAVFNAANEAAVAAFLERQIPFGRITELVQQAVRAIPPAPVSSLEEILAADREARGFVASRLDQSKAPPVDLQESAALGAPR